MAKRTHIEMAQFERVIYSCDLCGQELRPGQSPKVCRVCGREMCHLITVCYQVVQFPGDRQVTNICQFCVYIAAAFLQEINNAFVHYGTVEEEQLFQWKALSLTYRAAHAQ